MTWKEEETLITVLKRSFGIARYAYSLFNKTLAKKSQDEENQGQHTSPSVNLLYSSSLSWESFYEIHVIVELIIVHGVVLLSKHDLALEVAPALIRRHCFTLLKKPSDTLGRMVSNEGYSLKH